MSSYGLRLPNGADIPLPASIGAEGDQAGTLQPLVRFISNDEEETRKRKEAESRQEQPLVKSLSAHLDRLWEDAKTARNETDRELLRALRQRGGEYEPDILSEIRKSGGSEIFIMLTSLKCRAGESWLRDVMTSTSDRPWEVKPTPIPELPPDMEQRLTAEAQARLQQDLQQLAMVSMQTGQPMPQLPPDFMEKHVEEVKENVLSQIQEEAAERSLAMSSLIEDQLVEGGWDKEFSSFITDLVTFPAAIIKGPVIRKKKRGAWVNGEAGWEMQLQDRFTIEFERVSPFDIFPSADAVEVDDGYLFHKHRMSISQLNGLIGVAGYDDEAIRQAIQEYGKGGLREWLSHDYEKAAAEGRRWDSTNPSQTIDVLEFWGDVPGFMLREWGLTAEQVPDKAASYSCNVWKAGRWVIRAKLNPDPLGHRPYSKSSWEKIPGAFWGRGVPQLMRDAQQMCNASARHLANNLAIASGPQVVINDASRVLPGTDTTSIFPWKIWQFDHDKMGTASQPPVSFYQPNANIDGLLQVFNHFSAQADEQTGIPKYLSGESGGGVGSNASALSMLMANAGKAIKAVVGNVDRDVIEPAITRLYWHNMQYSDDESIKGDLFVRATGAASLVVKEQQTIRRTEFLQATNNPTDMQIIGIPGRAKILKQVIAPLGMNPDDIIPKEDELEMQQQQAAMQAQAQAAPMPPNAMSLNAAGEPAGGMDSNLMPPGGLMK